VWIENDSAVGNIHFSNSGTIASGEPFAVAIANYSSGPYGYAYVTNTGTISGGWLGLGWNGMDFYDSGDIHTGLAWLGDNCHVYISGLPTIDPTLGAGGSGTNNTLVFNLTGTLQSVNGQSASGTNLSAFALGTNGSIVVSGKTYRWSNFGSVSGTAIPATPLLAGPTGLTATAVSGSQVNLAWNGLTNATSYNVKRSTTSFGPYTTIASGVAATNYADTAAFAGVEYYYVVSAMVGGSETANSAEVALPYSKLTDAIIGTPGSWNNSGNTTTNVFDNNLNTFFDALTGNGDWVGLYFGASVSNAITQINYCPRSGFEGRMVGGIFQGANLADFSDAVTLYTVTAQPPSGVFTSASITNTSAFRYVRYLSPSGGYGNVAELQFYGYLAGASVPLPAAPGGLAAAAVSGSQINVGWNVVTNAASYNVKRSTTNSGPYVIIAKGVIATNYYDAGLMSGTTYYYVVSAVNAGGESANSAQAGVTPASNPPAPWMKLDIGTVGASGSASFTNGLFTVVGAGADIWNTADAFRFVYVPVTGDCTMVARVASVQNIDSWSKAGVMIRESLNANAANAFIAVTPGNGVTWQYRASTGGGSSNNNTPGLNAPYWVKLVRSGNTFTGYRSPDGLTWTQLGTATFTMASTAYVGLALTSHNNSSLCAATFDNVTAPNWPTSIPPRAPASLTAISGNTQVALSWTAASGATSYNVKRSSVSGGPYTVITNIATTTHTDTGLLNGMPYYYVVSALNLAGESTNSVQASAMPQAPPQLTMSQVTTNLTLSWPASATGFNLMTRTNLALGNWLQVTSPLPQLIGNQWQITLPISGDAQFFRLEY
jgi:fibronectin type 3 domain-containing protein